MLAEAQAGSANREIKRNRSSEWGDHTVSAIDGPRFDDLFQCPVFTGFRMKDATVFAISLGSLHLKFSGVGNRINQEVDTPLLVGPPRHFRRSSSRTFLLCMANSSVMSTVLSIQYPEINPSGYQSLFPRFKLQAPPTIDRALSVRSRIGPALARNVDETTTASWFG